MQGLRALGMERKGTGALREGTLRMLGYTKNGAGLIIRP